MKLDIRGSNLDLSQRLRSYIARSSNSRLSRFGPRVLRLHVRLSDVNGPRGGVDRVCKVVTTLRGAPPFLVEQRDTKLALAVDHALDRVTRKVARTMERIDRRWTQAGEPRRLRTLGW